MTLDTVGQLRLYGPGRCEPLSPQEARRWCRRLARGRYENFSVLSAVAPRELRDDFAALYAFCRWADDLGDELGDRQRHLEHLGWWREELRACFAGCPRHPVFVALLPAVTRHELPIGPFEDLIAAFEQDQAVDRYDTWEQLLGYCRLSADPVGRLVLMIAGEPRTPGLYCASDSVCTALQLTNHWQDVNRDYAQRNRVYIPREMNPIDRFEERLADTVRLGFAADRTFLDETRRVLRACVERTWPLYEQGEALLDMVSPRTRPVVGLFAAGGRRVLRLVELWSYETVLHRPRLSAAAKLALAGRAWVRARLAGLRRRVA
jgi:squalene synthase HpnC